MVLNSRSGVSDQPVECWTRIGIFGDRTCPRLIEEIHCRNCDVYCASGRQLLDRPLPEGYRDELTRRLAEPLGLDDQSPIPLVLFRLGGAWLALPSAAMSRTLSILPVVPVPGRSHPLFQGLINAHGEIRLCVSLAPLLETEMLQPVIDVSARVFPRMLEALLKGNAWVFAADEVVGSIECDAKSIDWISVSAEEHQKGVIQGHFEWYGLRVMLLDPEVLACHLEEALA